MPSYKICYLHEDGSHAGAFHVEVKTDKQAKILAHAMRLPGTRGLEVWAGAKLVYARPERPGVAPPPADAALQEAARHAA